MNIKSILTSLLVLSFATGLYNPIKAAGNESDTQSQQPQDLSDNTKSNKAHQNKGDQSSLVLHVVEANSNANNGVHFTINDNKMPSDLITELTAYRDKDKDSVSSQQLFWILMELPEGSITEEAWGSFNSWFNILSNDNLAEYSKLLITGPSETSKKKKQLNELFKDKGKLFFTNAGGDDNDENAQITLNEDKIIYATSFEDKVVRDNQNESSLSLTDIILILNPKQKNAEAGQKVEELEAVASHQDEEKGDENVALAQVPKFHLSWIFSAKGFQVSFVSAAEDSVSETSPEQPTYDISEFKHALARFSNEEEQIAILSIVFQLDVGDFVEGNFDKSLKLLAHFLMAFGDPLLEDHLLRLIITGNVDTKKVKKKLLAQIPIDSVEDNVFFVKEDNNNGNSINFNPDKLISKEQFEQALADEKFNQALDKVSHIPNETIEECLTKIEALQSSKLDNEIITKVIRSWCRELHIEQPALEQSNINIIILYAQRLVYIFLGPVGDGKSTCIFSLQGNDVKRNQEEENSRDDDLWQNHDEKANLIYESKGTVKTPPIGDSDLLSTTEATFYYHPTRNVTFCDTKGLRGSEQSNSDLPSFFGLKTNKIDGIVMVVSAHSILSGGGVLFKSTAHRVRKYFSAASDNTTPSKSILLMITKFESHKTRVMAALYNIIQMSYQAHFQALANVPKNSNNKEKDIGDNSLAALQPFFAMLLEKTVASGEANNIANFRLDEKRYLFFDPCSKDSTNETFTKLLDYKTHSTYHMVFDVFGQIKEEMADGFLIYKLGPNKNIEKLNTEIDGDNIISAMSLVLTAQDLIEDQDYSQQVCYWLSTFSHQSLNPFGPQLVIIGNEDEKELIKKLQSIIAKNENVISRRFLVGSDDNQRTTNIHYYQSLNEFLEEGKKSQEYALTGLQLTQALAQAEKEQQQLKEKQVGAPAQNKDKEREIVPDLKTNEGHLLLTASAQGYVLAYLPAAKNSDLVTIQAQPTGNTHMLKDAVERFINKYSQRQILSIALIFSGVDLVNDELDGFYSFLDIFSKLSKQYFIRLIITGQPNKEAVNQMLLFQNEINIIWMAAYKDNEVLEHLAKGVQDSQPIPFKEIQDCFTKITALQSSKTDDEEDVETEQLKDDQQVVQQNQPSEDNADQKSDIHLVLHLSSQQKQAIDGLLSWQLGPNGNIEKLIPKIQEAVNDFNTTISSISLTLTAEDLKAEQYNQALEYWLKIFSHQQLKQFSVRLVITGVQTTGDKQQAANHLNPIMLKVAIVINNRFEITSDDIASAKNIEFYSSWNEFISKVNPLKDNSNSKRISEDSLKISELIEALGQAKQAQQQLKKEEQNLVPDQDERKDEQPEEAAVNAETEQVHNDQQVQQQQKEEQNVATEAMQVQPGRYHLVFSFSGQGVSLSGRATNNSAQNENEAEVIQIQASTYDINQLKATLQQQIQHNQYKIASIVLECSGDAIIADNPDKHLALLVHFLMAFGDKSLKAYSIRLVITGGKNHEQVQEKLLEKIANSAKGNLFFVEDDKNSNAPKFNERKIIWSAEDNNIKADLLKPLENSEDITDKAIEVALTTIDDKLSTVSMVLDFAQGGSDNNNEFLTFQLTQFKNIEIFNQELQQTDTSKQISTISFKITAKDLIAGNYDKELKYWFQVFSDKLLASFLAKLFIIGSHSDQPNAIQKFSSIISDENHIFYMPSNDLDSSKNVAYHSSWKECVKNDNRLKDNSNGKGLASGPVTVQDLINTLVERAKLTDIVLAEGHLLFTFSEEGFKLSYLSTAENSELVPIQTEPTHDTDTLKSAFETFSNKSNAMDIRSIALKLSGEDLQSGKLDKSRFVFASFLQGLKKLSNDHLIRLIITGKCEHEDVNKWLSWEDETNIIWMEEDNKGHEYLAQGLEDMTSIPSGKIIKDVFLCILKLKKVAELWFRKSSEGSPFLKRGTEKSLSIQESDIIDIIISYVPRADVEMLFFKVMTIIKNILGIIFLVVATGKLYQWLVRKDAAGEKKSKGSAKANIANSTKQQQVPEDTSSKSPSADTTAPASNSSNRSGWGFQEWFLLIISVILVFAAGYWYFRIQKKS